MDRLGAHRAAAKRLLCDPRKRFTVEWLPAYAPELNPTEAAWSQTKYADLANFVPDDVIDLELEAERSLRDTCSKQKLLRSFFEAADLRLS